MLSPDYASDYNFCISFFAGRVAKTKYLGIVIALTRRSYLDLVLIKNLGEDIAREFILDSQVIRFWLNKSVCCSELIALFCSTKLSRFCLRKLGWHWVSIIFINNQVIGKQQRGFEDRSGRHTWIEIFCFDSWVLLAYFHLWLWTSVNTYL